MKERNLYKSLHMILPAAFLFAMLLFVVSPAPSFADTIPGDNHQWNFSIYGSATQPSTCDCESDLKHGNVRVFSTSNSGRLNPASNDGVSFYYTAIDPESENFILRATANVNTWNYNNGQEGFGLMAADRVGTNGDKDPCWNNSYMAAVTKVIYLWNGTRVSNSGDEITMRLGLGALERKGITWDNITEDNYLRDMSLFSSVMTPLDISCAGSGEGVYNLVGNYSNVQTPPGTIDEPRTSFDLCIEKNNTGYFVSYTDPNGGETVKKYYDPNALCSLDPHHVYIGFFTCRRMDITFTDISFTTSDPQTDPPAEEQPVSFVDPLYRVLSSTASNSSDYSLVFLGNADGTLHVERDGNEVYSGPVTAGTKARIPVELTAGDNDLEITMTPDPGYRPSEYEELSSYEPVTLTHTVSYENYASEPIYVSPDGTDGAQGTKEDPASIHSAVSKAAPGQSIYLTEGTYLMEKRLVIERGNNGTSADPITIMADPEASSRPVLDFQKKCEGLVLAADYWYLKGFDVTRSKDLTGGIRVCGNNNTLELMRAYENGDTGLWICTYSESLDTREDWPSNNLVLNCDSMLNADNGHEDADGFAAKVTCGEGNVFDGCISYYNADDGWDFYAKSQFGQSGKIVIKNCVTYKNGYLLNEDGTEYSAGNGNGFKLGGDGFPGGHEVINSIAFANKTVGLTSNSCPDVTVKNCTVFENGRQNFNLYGRTTANTDFAVDGLLSYAKSSLKSDSIDPRGTQDTSKYSGASNFYYKNGSSVNSKGIIVDSTWFVSTDIAKAINGGITRDADGSINMNGFLEITSKAPAGTGAHIGASVEPSIKDGAKYKTNIGTVKVISAKNQTVSFIKANTAKKSIAIPMNVKISGKSFAVIKIGSSAFKGAKATKVSIGANVKTISKYAFKGSKVKSLIVKTRKLTKKSVKGSLKSSKVSTLTIKVGSKSLNKKYLKKYKRYFTRSNAGRKVKLKLP